MISPPTSPDLDCCARGRRPVSAHCQAGRTVLLVAFHFPPCSGTSGVLRALKFAEYLPEFGWAPVVLTAHPRAYPITEPTSHADPCPVVRSWAFDVARHLAFRRRYPRLCALPDRWASWWVSGALQGLRLIRRFRPSVVWSTFPIATAHLIAFTLHRLTGLPWVADFRDPMTEEDYPADPILRTVLRCLESRTVHHAALATFTTPSAEALYRDRYPALPRERFATVFNGYDDAELGGLADRVRRPAPDHRPLRLLHSGMLYRDHRDPRPLFRALARLKRSGAFSSATLQIVFRGPSDEPQLGAWLREFDLTDVVQLLPMVERRAALEEAAQAHAFLLIQASSCNRQIPAKVYEYLALDRPILALVDPQGDTARLLRETGGATILPLEESALTAQLPAFLAGLCAGLLPKPRRAAVERYTRRRQTALLAACLGQVAQHRGVPCAHARTSA